MKQIIKYILLSYAILGNVFLGMAKVTLSHIFSDNMVLQRDKPICIWGNASPKENIRIRLNGLTESITAGKDGKWKISFPAMHAGGPYVLEIQGKENSILFDNVLIGDVWLCSGQSNMEFFLSGSLNAQEAIRNSANKKIRLFTVPKAIRTSECADFSEGQWEECNPLTSPYFSAVAYYFGEALQKEIDVPIGLINSSWGGTDIETWTSWETAVEMPQYEMYKGKTLEKAIGFSTKNIERYTKALNTPDRGITEKWYAVDYNTSKWKPVSLPDIWKDELSDEDGIVWYRTEVDLPQSITNMVGTLSLGVIDDEDIVFVNGVEVGQSNNCFGFRRYVLKPNILLPGKNIITVRVTDTGTIGGFTSSADDLYLQVGSEKYSLAKQWVYAPSLLSSQYGLKNAGNNPNSFSSLLYNGMIAPLVDYNIKGVIWYQGENNAGRAFAYKKQFPALINDWRKHWGYDFPFIWVQLANFMAVDEQPKESDWAELREAQNQTLYLPLTRQVVITDIGEANDIHPKNKKDVGLRLAANALNVAYERDTLSSGPVYQSMKLENGRILLSFSNIGKGLKAKGNKHGYLYGFAIAGDDRKFVWAKAFIQDNQVVVFNEKIAHPVAVRYGWGNNPEGMNLVNSAGWLASPFRTDTWPGITEPLLHKRRF